MILIERSSPLRFTDAFYLLVSNNLETRLAVLGLFLVLVIGIYCPISLLHSDELNNPFSIINQNPLVRIFGLPRHRSSKVLSVGESESKIGYSVSSNYQFHNSSSEDLIAIDGETETWTLSYRQGFYSGWEAGIILPLVEHSGGYLDRTIIRWHDWFGMPQGGRDQGPIDVLDYRLNLGGTNQAMLRERVSGIGDTVLFVGKSREIGVNVRAEIKVPTGETDNLLGSGGADIGVSADYGRYIAPRWVWGAMMSLTYLSEGAVEIDHESLVFALSSHLVFRISPVLALKLQWDLHSRPYKTINLEPLAKIGGILSFGGTIKLSERDRLDVIFVENVPIGETAPDFGFKLELARRI